MRKDVSKKEKKRMLFMDSGPNALTYKLLYFLKDYFKITLVSLSKRSLDSKKMYEELGINSYSFKIIGEGYFIKKQYIKGFKEIIRFLLTILKLKSKKQEFVFARTGDNWVGKFLFKNFKKAKKIYFPYDIGLFYWKNPKENRSKKDIQAEKYCFEHADFIFHKGPKNELKLIKEGEAKIKGKSIHFLPYCLDKWMVPIKNTKEKLKGMNITFIGHFLLDGSMLKRSRKEVYEKMAKQGIKIHLYDYDKLEDIKGKNMFIHKPLENKELNQTIGKYQYGTTLSFFNKELMDKRLVLTGMGNKLFSYLEAGIPIIVDNESKYVCEIIKKYNCGVIISEKDLPNIKKILEKQNYSKLLEGVKKARETFRMSKQINRIIKELGLKPK